MIWRTVSGLIPSDQSVLCIVVQSLRLGDLEGTKWIKGEKSYKTLAFASSQLCGGTFSTPKHVFKLNLTEHEITIADTN